MVNYRFLNAIFYFSLILFGCDEQLEPTEYKQDLNENERFLSHEWKFQFIVVGKDTIYTLTRSGTPNLDIAFTSDIYVPLNDRSIKYFEDYAYELGYN